MNMMLSLCIVLAVCLSVSNAFSLGRMSTRGKTGLKMVWSASESKEQYLIAPSILSANFAKLGEEVGSVHVRIC